MIYHELIIIGGGPAGMAAAVTARERGISDLLIIERENMLGGILKQCIHNGFGLHYFSEELTGSEYAAKFVDKIDELKISYKLNTMVLSVDGNKMVYTSNEEDGYVIYKAKAIILAMGCRERPRGNLRIPGSNPSGVLTAGTAQRFVNIDGYLPGTSCVILGSGDIGLIMARRLTLEGVKVKAVCEIMPHPGGLVRNIEQCLNDYDIPLKLSHTVFSIHGKKRVEGVTIAMVDEHFNIIENTKEYIACDTLLLSVGLIPENELTFAMGAKIDSVTNGAFVNQNLETSVEGVFSCGNVLHVHDLVDYVTLEGIKAAEHAVEHIKNNALKTIRRVTVVAAAGIRYVMPQYIDITEEEEVVRVYFRSRKVFKEVSTFASCDDVWISKRRHLRLLPAEMEFIEVNTNDIKDDTVYIGVDA
ncbi:MAG: FAD-dependent oxidoreductase [Clostridia bacterium]|nr:FAD-dependent oxidoreductase [Clostridia bacterium]